MHVLSGIITLLYVTFEANKLQNKIISLVEDIDISNLFLLYKNHIESGKLECEDQHQYGKL